MIDTLHDPLDRGWVRMVLEKRIEDLRDELEGGRSGRPVDEIRGEIRGLRWFLTPAPVPEEPRQVAQSGL